MSKEIGKKEKDAACKILFEEQYLDEIQKMLNAEIEERELPEKSLHIISDATYSLCIYEPDYPMAGGISKDPKRNTTIINFKVSNVKNEDVIDLKISYDQYDYICKVKEWAFESVKEPQALSGFVNARMKLGNEEFIPLLRECVDYSVRNYNSKATKFGCCSRFKECSAAGKCTHPNKLYSRACYYRILHLDNGEVLYGN